MILYFYPLLRKVESFYPIKRLEFSTFFVLVQVFSEHFNNYKITSTFAL